jgi:hypothetical protein
VILSVRRSSDKVRRRSDSSASACCPAGPGSIHLGVHELTAEGLEPLCAVHGNPLGNNHGGNPIGASEAFAGGIYECSGGSSHCLVEVSQVHGEVGGSRHLQYS